MKKVMMLTMFLGFVLICSGVAMAAGQPQGLNEQSQQNGKILEIREVSQVDKLKEVQEIPVVETLLDEVMEEAVVAECPLQQRKVELQGVMEDRVASLIKLIAQDKQQVDEKQADQRVELQKRMEEIQKELGQMFLEYMALRENLAGQTDPVTTQKDDEFLGRVLKLHKEAGTVTTPAVAKVDENIVKYYVAGGEVKDVKVDEKGGSVVYRIKTADGQEKVLTAKELEGSNLVIDLQKKEQEQKIVYELKKAVALKKLDEQEELQEFIGITSPIKFLSEKKKEGDKEVSYMIIMSGDNPPKEVTRIPCKRSSTADRRK